MGDFLGKQRRAASKMKLDGEETHFAEGAGQVIPEKRNCAPAGEIRNTRYIFGHAGNGRGRGTTKPEPK